jgi:hypothetical protein
MAAVTATINNVVIERGPDDARAAAIGNLRRATVYFDNGGTTAVAGGTDTLDANLATAIQNSVRDGLTVTVRTVAISQALTQQTSAGVETTFAGFLSLSSNTVSITPKTDGYVTGSTNGSITANTPIVRPYGVYVAYTVA